MTDELIAPGIENKPVFAALSVVLNSPNHRSSIGGLSFAEPK
jgi:hypothetical protein